MLYTAFVKTSEIGDSIDDLIAQHSEEYAKRNVDPHNDVKTTNVEPPHDGTNYKNIKLPKSGLRTALGIGAGAAAAYGGYKLWNHFHKKKD